MVVGSSTTQEPIGQVVEHSWPQQRLVVGSERLQRQDGDAQFPGQGGDAPPMSLVQRAADEGRAGEAVQKALCSSAIWIAPRYLFAASRGLGSWFHNCDRPALSAKLGLSDSQRPLFGQTVGYAKRTEA